MGVTPPGVFHRSFWNYAYCSRWSIDVHVVLRLSSHYFYQLFLLCFFPGSTSIRIYTLWAQLFLELFTDHFEIMHLVLQSLKICMWFLGYLPVISYLHFCRTCFWRASFRPSVRPYVRSSVHPSTFTLGVLWPQLLLLQFCADLKLCMCFLHGMRMCMWFEYVLVYFFVISFHIVNLVIFHPPLYRQWVPLVSATPLTILYWSFWNFAFCEDMHVV